MKNLEAIRQYLEQFNPYAARDVAAAIIDTGDSLMSFPNRGRRIEGTALREVLTGYPYVLRYRVIASDVIILRIRHMARHPIAT